MDMGIFCKTALDKSRILILLIAGLKYWAGSRLPFAFKIFFLDNALLRRCCLMQFLRLLSRLALCVVPLVPVAGLTQSAVDEELKRRCWQATNAERTAANLREPVAVSFSNLKSGYAVRSPFWVEFGIRGMGVMPAGTAHDKAGHHHLLINKKLPANHREKIPFDDSHRHFGKGQTGTLIDLPPGNHTLRLLFADHEHRPYFVFSPEITIQVVAKRAEPAPRIDERNFAATCAAWYQDAITTPRDTAKEVYVKNLRDGEQLETPMRLSLGVAGFGIAPADKSVKDTGHFAVNIIQAGKAVTRYVWRDGRTEAVLDLPRGEIALQPSLLAADGTTLLQGQTVRATVLRTAR
jgi:hypothetical protein